MLTLLKSKSFDDWLWGLRDRQARARVQARIDRLAMGNPGDVKPTQSGISELRIDYGPGYRVYYHQRARQLCCSAVVEISGRRMPTSVAPSRLQRTGRAETWQPSDQGE